MVSENTETEGLMPEGTSHDYGTIEGRSRDLRTAPAVPLYKQVFGIFLVVLAGCAFTCANVIQKHICPDLNFWSLFLIRSLTQMPVMACHLIWSKTRDKGWTDQMFGPREARCKIAMQGTFGGFLLLAIFVAVKHVPLGTWSMSSL